MRWTSRWSLLGLPLIDVRSGRSEDPDEPSVSWAIGWIAIGGCACSPLLAIGGLAVGGIALGGGALGILTLGGLAIGYWSAAGTAVGFFSAGGMAVAWHWAVGGMALAKHAALGGMARAAEANTDAAREYVLANLPWVHIETLLQHLLFTVIILAIPLGIIARTRSPDAE